MKKLHGIKDNRNADVSEKQPDMAERWQDAFIQRRKDEVKKNCRRVIILGIAVVLGASSGCVPSGTAKRWSRNILTGKGEENPKQEEKNTGALPAVGDRISGFTVDSVSQSAELNADLLSFTHEKSGARLLYIKNDDPELAFSVSYHTPYVDETDTNHIFEHAIIASSEKYPGSDLFFDMAAKSYNTFINAFTYDTFTAYPLSTESEEQLIKLMDVYLSCMTKPDILKNENIFRREALRYELTAPDEEIRMVGTVYSEDFGSLTDVGEEAKNNVADALYPGQYASNMIGRAHRNYRDLSYEAALATYDRCYHFDNSLFYLYGDMDYKKVLDFIDREYLSKSEKNGTDLSAYEDGPSKSGYVESTVYAPAYRGDTEENASQIDYAFSLEDDSWEDLIAWSVLADAMNKGNSVFNEILGEYGINNQADVSVNLYSAKPYVTFRLYYARPEQGDMFKEAVQQTLSIVSEEGIDKDTMNLIEKQAEVESSLVRDQNNVGVEIFPDIANYWAHTGQLEYFDLCGQVFENIENDGDQKIFRSLAEKTEKPVRSALVTTVPKPGMAEDIIAERDAYLAEKKASMTEEEIEQLIRDTASFNKWNEKKISNNDFMIDPADVPEKKSYTDYTRNEKNGVTYYMAPVNSPEVGSYRLYFDTSDFSNEELLDLELYKFLIGNMRTKNHTEEELFNLSEEYLYKYSFSNLYPEKGHPMTAVSWKGLTQDYKTSLGLIFDMMQNTDFSDTEVIREMLERYAGSYDWSRNGEPLSVAQVLAGSIGMKTYAYRTACEGQDYYNYLLDIQERLEQDKDFGEILQKRLDAVTHKLMKRGSLVFSCAAPKEALAEIRSITAGYAQKLPLRETDDIRFVLPDRVKSVAAAVESPDQHTVMAADAYSQPDFRGRYIPFLMAVSDQYLVPVIRFQMGAYSSGVSFTAYSGDISVYSSNDPNAAGTVRAFADIPNIMTDMELTEEELNGYILTAVSSAGMERGVFSKAMAEMENEITGYDNKKTLEIVNDMKNARLSDQKDAAEIFKGVFADAGVATVGNEDVLKRDQEAYDKYVSFKKR